MSFAVYYSQIILPFSGIQCELLAVSLKKKKTIFMLVNESEHEAQWRVQVHAVPFLHLVSMEHETA